MIACMCDMYTNSAEGFPAGHTSKAPKSTFMGRMISSRDMTPHPGHQATIFNLDGGLSFYRGRKIIRPAQCLLGISDPRLPRQSGADMLTTVQV